MTTYTFQRRSNVGFPRSRRRKGKTIVDSAAARDHIEYLRSLGMNDFTIAAAAGLTSTTVRNVRVQKYDGVVESTATAILTATPRPTHHQARVLPYAAIRRYQALQFMGWTQPELAARLGIEQQELSDSLRRKLITWETHSAIARLYRELCDRDGGNERVKRAARRNGWLSPVAWDDIDDYYEKPSRGAVYEESDTRRLTVAEVADRRARVAELTRAGLSANEIAMQVGISERSVVRDRAVAS